MPAAKDILAATLDSNAAVADTFKQHFSDTRADTKTTILNALRQSYPTHHVTEAGDHNLSFVEFAEAGKATLVLDSAPEAFNATRAWKPVGEGVEKRAHPGKLEDEYRFARFQYIWEGHEFLLYYVAWETAFGGLQRMCKWTPGGNNVPFSFCSRTKTWCPASCFFMLTS